MTSYRLGIIACCGLLIATASSCARLVSQPTPTQNVTKKKEINSLLSAQISQIVVKVIAKSSSGSGIILNKNNNVYSVVTNRHVVSRGSQYQIQTSDGNIYQGKLRNMSQQEDLAVLEFKSDRLYAVAKITSAPLKTKDSLLSAGFPFDSDRLQITSGRLLLKTHKPLKQGYQLGYTNFIYKGMSGGAIFNTLGEVVGVNGRSANPIIPDYQYQDLSYPAEHLQQQMTQLSWGIPIDKAIELINN